MIGPDWSALDCIHKASGIRPNIPIGKGFTVDEYAKRYHIAMTYANPTLRKLVRDGKIRVIGRRGKFYVYDVVQINGRNRG